jgi:hypothetical protein
MVWRVLIELQVKTRNEEGVVNKGSGGRRVFSRVLLSRVTRQMRGVEGRNS